MSWTQNELIQLGIRYDSNDASCIRFAWIFTDLRDLVIGISSDLIANKAIHIF